MDTLAVRDHRRARAWQIYLIRSARSCGPGRMSCVRWLTNTNAFKQPKRLSPTGLRPGHAPASPSAVRPRRDGVVPAGWVRARRSSLPAERDGKREKVLALVRERPGITKAELKAAAGISSAGVAQNLRRMLDRAEVREEALPGGAVGYRIADGPNRVERQRPPGRVQLVSQRAARRTPLPKGWRAIGRRDAVANP